MKRFFSRFSAGGPASPPKPVDSSIGPSREKPPLSSSTTLPGEKVKALAAKYEAQGPNNKDTSSVTFSRNSQHQDTKSLQRKPLSALSASSVNASVPPDATLQLQEALAEFGVQIHHDLSTTAPSKPKASTLPPSSVPNRMLGSSLPVAPDGRRHSAEDERSPISSNRKNAKEQRQLSGASQTGTSAISGLKTVAFAPSPEKPSHVTSHTLQRPSLTSLAFGKAASTDAAYRSYPSGSDSSFNFAKPTVASQARARSTARISSSEASSPSTNPPCNGSAFVERERANSSQHRSAKMKRTNSLQSPRRAVSCTSGVLLQDPTTISISSPIAIGSRVNTAGVLTNTNLRPSSTDANTIPFSSPIDPHSTSPLSFPSSVPMQPGGSGSLRPQSRKGCLTPQSFYSVTDSSCFASSSAGPKAFGFPSWSEMTQEELVNNLGPRERTRQEVLWEIVASEERYVRELEKAKELYIDALLYPDEFDPHRLTSQSHSPVDAETEGLKLALNPAQNQLNHRTPPPPHPNVPTPESEANTSELPIAARFMSTTSAINSGEGSSVGHGSPYQPCESAFIAHSEAQKAAGYRSPYAVGLSASAANPGLWRSEDHRRSSVGSYRSPLGLVQPSGQSQASLAHGLGLGLSTPLSGKERLTTSTQSNQSTPSKRTPVLSKTQKLRSKSKAAEIDPMILTVPLPPSLKAVLEAISDGLVESHGLLSDALKTRYDDQWPLVRSLADVFMKHAYILKHYAVYVCHLQRALEELEEAALMERAMRGKKLRKERLSNTVGLGRTVSALEAVARDQGYAGLSIFISTPFQRLLKYPLLFQNLLFHTDPSTHEFESTVSMVVEVERLVRSIEDEKINAEERDKTRDAFARIDGLTDKNILRPRPDRILIEEKALYNENPRRSVSESAPNEDANGMEASDTEAGESGTELSSSQGQRGGGGNRWNASPGLRAALRSKRSYRRLSDFLGGDDKASLPSKAPNMGSKKDIWLIRFSDVEIKCQRIGVTALPMVSSAALTLPGSDGAETGGDNSEELADLTKRSKDSKERLKALRNTTLRAKTRNLYKFISVVAWRNAAKQPSQTSNQETNGAIDGLPTSHEVDEEDLDDFSDDDDDDDDKSSRSSSEDGVGGYMASDKYVRQTKLSFSYWGDKVEPRITISQDHASSTTQSSSVAAAYRSLSQGANQPSVHGTASRAAALRAASLAQGHNVRPLSSSGNANLNPLGSGNPGSVMAPVKRASLGPAATAGLTLSAGVSSRLAEPISSSSITTAPESIQVAVAQMHAKQRNEKFGGRLRTHADHPHGIGTSNTNALGSSMAIPKRQLTKSS